MTQVVFESDGVESVIELRHRGVAALLAWLVPGAGHLYQGRNAKGLLFGVCILGTFFYGLLLGKGQVVYASWEPRPGARALTNLFQPFVCQLGVGLPALPAVIEGMRFHRGQPPLLGIMVPPTPEQLNNLHRDLHRYFELGTFYTVIAGLLNILVIFDAWGGPMKYIEDDKKKKSESAQPASAPATDKTSLAEVAGK